MYSRVTRYKMKAGSRDAATELMTSLKGDIMGMPGMRNFINVMNEDGSGYVVAVVESKATSEANAERVKALWGKFADHLETMPTPEGYDVIANWS